MTPRPPSPARLSPARDAPPARPVAGATGAPGTPPAGGASLARQMAEAGASREETARALGIHRSSLTRLARRHGIAFRDGRQNARRACPRGARWRELHEQGLTAHEAAAVMGASVRAAYQAARRGGYRFRRCDRDDTLRRRIARLIAEGCWLREAARRLAMDARSVARVAARHGLTFPPYPALRRTPDPVEALSPAERADWRLFRWKGFSRDEALRIVLDDRARQSRKVA
jgi:transcriptional regulator with GAF, ATPase, and Fis domain